MGWIFSGLYKLYLGFNGSINIFDVLSLSLIVLGIYILLYREDFMFGHYLFALCYLTFLFLITIHVFVEGMGSWDPNLYRLYYSLTAFFPAVLASGLLDIYGDRLLKNVSRAYLIYSVAMFILIVFISFRYEVKTFLLDTPYIGGHAMPTLARIIHPLITIPSLLLIVYVTFHRGWNDPYAYDLILISGSTVMLALGGLYLRAGSILFFHLLEFLGALGFLLGVYIMNRSQSV